MARLSLPAPSPIDGDALRLEFAAAGFGVVDLFVENVDEQLLLTVETDASEADASAVVDAHTGAPTLQQQADLARVKDADQGVGSLATTAGIRAKCKAVLAGTDTFTAAQMQRAVAALVLLALRDRADT